MKLPPLDVHAHVALDVSLADLEHLGAVIFIATRSTGDFELVSQRQDQASIWGVGCHPSLVGVHRQFDEEAFKESLMLTPYIAEVGLDGESRVPLESQINTLHSILRIVQQQPRIVSLHSYRATRQLLEILAAQELRTGYVLHWWLGDESLTRQAIELGCFFSVNYSMIRSTEVWRQIPLNRLLVETDHPSGDRFSSAPRQPGHIQDVEEALAKQHKIHPSELRDQVWANFANLVSSTSTYDLLPLPVRRMIDFAETKHAR